MNQGRLIFILLTMLILILSISVVRSWFKMREGQEIIKQAEDKIEKARDNNENLQRILAQVGSREFIEKEARNRLNMGKEDEIVLLMPSIAPIAQPTPTPIDTSSNMVKWARIFI